MVNLQTLLRMVAILAGPMVGFLIGHDFGGWVYGILFAIPGLFIALMVVETPYAIVKWLDRRRIRLATSEVLKAALEDDFRHFGRLNILRELQRRGESIEFEMPRLVRFLASPSPVDRLVGCAALKEFFPAIGARLSDYHPFHAEAPKAPIVAELLRDLSLSL